MKKVILTTGISPFQNIKCFIYTSGGEKTERWISEFRKTLGLNPDIYIQQNIDALKKTVLQSSENGDVLIFVFETSRPLNDCLALQSVLADRKTVLVLPDHKKTTIAKAYSLYPRFIAFIDEDMAATMLVVENMIAGCMKNHLPVRKRYG